MFLRHYFESDRKAAFTLRATGHCGLHLRYRAARLRNAARLSLITRSKERPAPTVRERSRATALHAVPSRNRRLPILTRFPRRSSPLPETPLRAWQVPARGHLVIRKHPASSAHPQLRAHPARIQSIASLTTALLRITLRARSRSNARATFDLVRPKQRMPVVPRRDQPRVPTHGLQKTASIRSPIPLPKHRPERVFVSTRTSTHLPPTRGRDAPPMELSHPAHCRSAALPNVLAHGPEAFRRAIPVVKHATLPHAMATAGSGLRVA